MENRPLSRSPFSAKHIIAPLVVAGLVAGFLAVWGWGQVKEAAEGKRPSATPPGVTAPSPAAPTAASQ